MRTRWSLPFVAFAALLCEGRAFARADPTDERGVTESTPATVSPTSARIGVLGGIGFPNPLAVEGFAEVGGLAAVGVEYGALPRISVYGVDASLWSLAADARVYPFRGAFFVGLRAGRQHAAASATVTIESFGSATEALTLDSWFVNPRVGFLWSSPIGPAFGIDAGIQIPVSSTISSTLPLSLYPSAQRAIGTVGRTVLPTVDLLRIGLVL